MNTKTAMNRWRALAVNQIAAVHSGRTVNRNETMLVAPDYQRLAS